MSSEVRPRSRQDLRSRLARHALIGCVVAALVVLAAPLVRADPPPATPEPESPTPAVTAPPPAVPTPPPAVPAPAALPPPVSGPPPAASVVLKQAPVASAAPAPSATRAPAHLGKLEQESVNDALADLGIRLDWQPIGKTVRAVHVVNQEVFSRRDWWFRWFNIFHRTTRDYIIERELLIHAGDRYDPALVEESVRNLQSTSGTTVGSTTFPAPDLSSVIVIIPIISPQPGTVDLLVVTRDVWSLRFNTNFEFQQSTLSSLQTSLSENNLFGWRKFFSFGFSLDLGAYWIGPTYFDPNIAGTRLTLYAAANAYYSRDTGDYEGNAEAISVHYPLYSLSSRWGAGLELVHSDTLVRSFRGLSPRLVNLVDIGPDAFSPTLEAVPYIYRRKITTVDATVTRQFGVSVIHRLTFGHHIDTHRSLAPDDFPDPDQAPLFLAQYAPVSETRSEPFVAYSLFTPRYAIYRDLNTFDLRENVLLGPTLTASLAYGSPELGADFRAFPMALSLGYSAAAPRGGSRGDRAARLGATARPDLHRPALHGQPLLRVADAGPPRAHRGAGDRRHPPKRYAARDLRARRRHRLARLRHRRLLRHHRSAGSHRAAHGAGRDLLAADRRPAVLRRGRRRALLQRDHAGARLRPGPALADPAAQLDGDSHRLGLRHAEHGVHAGRIPRPRHRRVPADVLTRSRGGRATCSRERRRWSRPT